MSGPAGPLPSLPGFRLVRELGRGGMGIVYEAWSEARGRAVALKLLHAGGALDPDAVARLQREVAAQARLSHPNLIGVVDVGLRGATPWVALELVRGESLAQVLARGPLDPRSAAVWARQLAQALAHAHERGVLHRDLKPANVLIDEHGQPRLADLGLALLSDERARLTATGVIVGTPAYMAPEQASGQRLAPDPRTDVYGLGAVLYEMLSGAPPFSGASHLEVLQAVLSLPPPPPSQLRPGLDPALEAICLRCLAKAPDRRPPDAQAVADALGAWLAAPRGVAAAPPTRPAPARLAAFGGVVLLVAGGVWLLAARAPAPEGLPRPGPEPAALSSSRPALPPLAAARAAWAEGDLQTGLALYERAAGDEDPARRAEALFRWHLLVLIAEPERLIGSPRRLVTPPLESLLKLPPVEPWTTLARVTARIYDQPSGCARVLRDLQLRGADEPALWLLLGFAQRGDPARARQHLARAGDLDPRPVLAELALHRLSLDDGDVERAEEHLARALAALEGPSTRGVRAQLEAQRAQLALRSGENERALAAAERALALDPDPTSPPRAWRVRTAARLSQGDEAGARADLVRLAAARGERPDELDLQLELADIWNHELHDTTRALELLAPLERRFPADPRVASARAGVLTQVDSAAALALLDTLPGESLPKDGLRTRQSLRRLTGDRQGAARDLDLILARWPDESVMRQIRASHRLQATDLQGALEDYDVLVAQNARPGLLLERALARRPVDPAGALADLDRVEADADLLDPHVLRQLAVQLANLGRMLSRPDLLDRSLKLLDALLRESPGDLDALSSRVAALYNRGRLADAAREATRVLELAPAGSAQARSARSTRSLAREGTGDPVGARADLELLLQDCGPEERADLEERLARLPR